MSHNKFKKKERNRRAGSVRRNPTLMKLYDGMGRSRRRKTSRAVLEWLGLPWHKEGNDLFLLWTYGGYDGTCAGICAVNDVPHYYHIVNGISARSRLFALAKLTDEQFLVEQKYAQTREELIGGSEMYFYENGQRRRGHRHPGMTGVMPDLYFAAMDVLKKTNLPRVDWKNLTVTGVWEW